MTILKRTPPLTKDLEDRLQRTGQAEELKDFVNELVEKVQPIKEKTQHNATTDQ